MFTAVIFIIAKNENKPNVHQLMNDKQNAVYSHNGRSFGDNKE